MTRSSMVMIVAVSALTLGPCPAAGAATSTSVTLEGSVGSVTPFGDVRVREGGGQGRGGEQSAGQAGLDPDATEEPESDRHEKKVRRSSCSLTAGAAVLACATTLEGALPVSCRRLEESTCDFSVELPLEQPAALAGFFFVQDDDGNGAPGEGERIAELIDPADGAPVCAGDVVRIEDVAVDFAEAAPNAAAIHKVEDACAGS